MGRAGEGRRAALVALLPAILLALAFRALCYAAMTALALHSELRPAPTLPDAVLALVPYVPWVGRANYLLWLLCYLPLTLAFLWSEPRRWVRYMVTGGLVSLARGLCIAATGLGPPDPAHAGPGIGGRSFLEAWADLCSPLGVFARGTASAYLTKDLFFSGHTATTLLILLYVWRRPWLRAAALIGHVLVVASVFLSHLHYTVDVLGAYAFTFALFALREWRPRPAAAPG
ncbi:sphingomyelin synthase family protein [Anaeromyxobacter paludicola]|uniref:sphingomyelin synthase family protein n=1 Tax=Anaeromyxobacter paludicola TaxID=2918171 RepID=UPI0020C151F3|nr:sphingomyelin synthase family protein [Anaeromyxobacter paludicola]